MLSRGERLAVKAVAWLFMAVIVTVYWLISPLASAIPMAAFAAFVWTVAAAAHFRRNRRGEMPKL